jgi:two-component system response regulator BaeR
MTEPLILIVEDEVELARLLADYMERSAMRVHLAYEGSGVAEWVRQNNPQLVLLDIQLPGLDGIGVCRELRSFSSVPIIMVTARVDEVDRLLGLELGADDYICKPFSPREVVARVKAVLRRSTDSPSLTGDELVVDCRTYRASFRGQSAELTPVELHLLESLLGQPERVFSRNELMDRVYPDHRIVSDRTIDSHVKKLRRKLATLTASGEFVHSVYGAGYKCTRRPV